ncbi:hypothetical protein [Roseibium sediminis]|uniref:hypothetical protein n=1 Tax=Roseibium sediminis TaxID=1775174 RepID=UPI00123D6189|nr:hypothetical protein [Roseibium sediminis]
MTYRFLNPHQDTAFSVDPSSKKQARITDEAHLAYIRKLPSLVSGAYGCEACHVRYGDPKHRKRRTPMGRKPDDAWTVPMTPEEHRLQHGGNEQAFWQGVGIDPLEVATQLYANSGNIEVGRKIISEAQKVR